jgi:hypothetical protein
MAPFFKCIKHFTNVQMYKMYKQMPIYKTNTNIYVQMYKTFYKCTNV